MKLKLSSYLAVIAGLLSAVSGYAQSNRNVGIGTNAPDPSAVLDISSDSKGILIPRLTSTQRYAITAPANGLIVYDVDSVCLFYYNNFKWTSLCNPSTASNGIHIDMVQGSQDIQLGGPLTKNTEIPLAGKKLMFPGTGNVAIGNNTPDPSAILDLSNSNNTGMIVPKVALSSTGVAAPVTSPALSLLVFNTATQNNVKPGYYFWDGGQWVRLFSTNLPVVSTVSVTAPIVNTGTAQDPNIGITTSDLTSSGVIAVTGGVSRLTGTGGASIDVTGTNGGVLYGTGASSTFTPAGNTGEILKSNGAAAPTWVSPNSTLTTYPVSGSNTVNVNNGNNQVVGGAMSIDIKGAQGAVLYGTGASSGFTATGLQGQYLQSNGISTPTWVNGRDVSGSSVVSVTNGTQQVVGASNMTIDVKGPSGTLLYGNGASSAFTNQGNAGELLQSNGTGAPTWVNPNAALSVSDLTGGSVINVTNGVGKVVGSGGANVDVSGTAGAILYGTGTSSSFTAQGTSGQVLKSAGAGTPAWVTPTDVNGSTVVNVTNGSGQAIGNTNMNIDVKGANGGVLYGTGSSSDFTPAGTAGQVLKSTGAGAPVWASPNATLATNDVTGGSVMNITNGTGQIVGGANMNVDVKGTNGGLLYGTGTSSSFTAAGTAGQYLQSTGAGAPAWTNRADVTGGTVVSVTNGNNQVMNGAMNVDVVGANGGVMYGTGTSSGFTAAGTAGQVLKSTGAGAPVWSSPNATLATNDIVPAASSAVVVSNGTGQVVGGSNVSVDVQGTNGGVFYGKGTGTAAAFSTVGATGQILKSNGAAAPTWVAPNTTLTTSNVTGGTVMNIGNGTGQVVGASNLTIDVTGANGGVMYGTGASSAFTGAGTSGQLLKSNGAGAPTWVNPNATLTTNNVTGGTVMNIGNGTGQVVGASNLTLDVTGAAGGVMYGTGTSSNFTPAGSAGQVLKSNGVAAPGWASSNNLTGSTVVSVSNGTNQLVGATNASIDVSGTNGGVLYGTGASSNFSAAGTSGQVLKSNGAGAPTWVNPNTTLTTQNITNAGNGVITVTGGSSQIVGATNATVDVAGTNGGVLYGTGASSNFSTVGTSGQILKSNGAAAPTWVNANTALTTNNVTGGSVINITNGTGQVVGGSNMTVDVSGTNGGVLYGTGTSSGFSAVGTSGQILKSNGAAAPTWVNANTALTTQNITNAGNGVITVTGGASQVVGATNATVDVAGTNGGVLYGTGSSSAFTSVGTAGQVLTSNGAGAPTWTTPAGGGGGAMSASNGLNVVGTDIRMGGSLIQNTSITQAGFSYSQSGGVVNLNDNSNSVTNINTGTSTAAVNIANGASAGAVQIGKSNTITVNNAQVGINNPGATEALDVTGNVRFSGALMPNNAAGTAGQVLTSAGAGTAPTWTTPSGGGTVTASNGLNVSGSDVRLGGTLTTNTTITQAGNSLSISGGTINLNDAANNDVNIATGTSTGNINLGTGASAQSVNVATGAGAKTLSLGSTNSTSTTDIKSGSGGVSINENINQITDINTGTSTGAVNIANGASAGTVQIGKSNTVTVTSSGSVGVGSSPVTSAKLDVTSTTQGFMPPRMTTAQRDLIASPAAGLMIYNTTCDNINYYSSAGIWKGPISQAPVASAATNLGSGFTANWSAGLLATTYYLDVSTVNTFATFVTGYNNLNVGNVTSYNVTGLSCGTTYYYRVRTGYCEGSSASSNTITAVTPATGSGTIAFSYTGSAQTWTVPCGVTSITVKMWGAGGAGSNYSASYLTTGGGGAFVSGTLTVTGGQVLTLVVGGAGNMLGTSAYGGGGTGYSTQGAGGGGRSSIQATAGTDLVTAGGGGGGGYPWTQRYGNGGGGGATTGSNGTVGYTAACENTTGMGKGGTISAGGAGGTQSCSTTAYNGLNGSLYTGGNNSPSVNLAGSGGGGGGYYGGGAGDGYYGAGGGGGSSFVTGTGFTLTTNTGGTTIANGSAGPANPGGTADANYSTGIGIGSYNGSTPGAGRIVIIY